MVWAPGDITSYSSEPFVSCFVQNPQNPFNNLADDLRAEDLGVIAEKARSGLPLLLEMCTALPKAPPISLAPTPKSKLPPPAVATTTNTTAAVVVVKQQSLDAKEKKRKARLARKATLRKILGDHLSVLHKQLNCTSKNMSHSQFVNHDTMTKWAHMKTEHNFPEVPCPRCNKKGKFKEILLHLHEVHLRCEKTN